jgi:hypothetical protein
MPIQNVNGRNVYVLTPKATDTDGKTTSGKNWATLYSDLRWQVWEAQKENEANKIKLDLMSFEAKKDYYDQQKKFLQNRIAELQDIKLKAGVRDGSSKTIDQALRAYDLSAPKSVGGRGASGPKFSRRTTTGRVTSFGDPILDESGKDKALVVDTISGPLDVAPSDLKMGNTPVAFQEGTPGGKTIIGPNPALAKLTELLGDEAVALLEDRKNRQTSEDPLGTGDIDAKIRELENQLGDLQRPDLNIDTDLQNRTQRAFEQNVGVIGRGGGPFGLAPRPRRLAPRVDQPRATAFAQELVAKGTEEKDRRSQLEEYRTSLLKKREEAQALMSTDDAMEFGLSPGEAEAQFFLSDVDRQIAAIDERLSQPTIAQKVMADEGFIERKAGEFLLRGPRRPAGEFEPPRMAGSPVESVGLPDADVTVGEGTFEPPPDLDLPGRMRARAMGIEVMTPEERQAAEDAVRSAGLLPTKPEGELPAAPFDLSGVQGRPPLRQGPAQLSPEETPLPSGQPIALNKEQALFAGPAVLDNPNFIPSASLIEEAQDYYKGMTIERDEGRPRKILAPQLYFGGETQMVKEYLKDQIRDQAPVGVDVGKETEAVDAGPSQGSLRPTTKQRKDMYSFKVSSEGIKLAQKPKQLARLAKTSLPEEKRPQHIVIVDKLYETNSGKTNAFRLTYDEISRVFANDPKKRTESHKYLVAKDVLEGNKREPLA